MGGKRRRDSSEEGEDVRTSDREHGMRQARRRDGKNGDEE